MQFVVQRGLGTLHALLLALSSLGSHAATSFLEAKSSLESPTPNRYHDELTGMFKLRQKTTGRYLDSYEKRFFANRPGYEAVTRPVQSDYSQAWVLHQEPNGLYSITQAETGRFLDAFENNPRPPKWTWDRTVVTRIAQESTDNLSQRWIITSVPGSVEGSGEHYIRQASTQLFLDGFTDQEHDFQVCLRPNQTSANGTHDPTQVWILHKEEELPDLDGIYIFKQKDTGRWLDGHQSTRGNYEFITRAVEFSQSQHFVVRRVMGEAYTIIQESSGRFMDAYETASPDWTQNFAVVGRPYQHDDSQKWFIEKVSYNEFRFMHHVTGRMLTAYEDDAHDWMVHTGPRDELEDEIWLAQKIGEIPQLEGIWTIQQKSTGLYLDAYPTEGPFKAQGGLTWEAVLRGKQNDTSQHWVITKKDGEVYEVKQESSNKCLDAWEQGDARWFWNYTVCIRPPQNNPSQLWYFQWVQGDEFTIRQHGNTRYLDAWPDAAHDHLAVTREFQFNDDSQIFIMKQVGSLCTPMASCLSSFQCGAVDDGCGGEVFCGPHSQTDGHCNEFNIFANHSYDCVDHVCVCAPKDKCDDGNVCGWEDDGCGGRVFCGQQGNCTTKNPLSLQPDKCLFDPSNFTQTPLGLPPNSSLAPNNHSCVCQPKPICTNTSECGVEDDGCGGFVTCNHSPMANLAGNCSLPQHVCSKNHTCECVPKTVCDAGNDCGFQDDGCGGTIACGNNGTCTNGTNFHCNASSHTCTCKPKPCGENLCGILPDDGCGKEINCGGCQVANKMCNNKNHMCEIVPGPPCPSLVCGGPTGPGPSPGAASPFPSPFPMPMPAPQPSPAPGPLGPAGGPAAGPAGPAPAPGPDVTPIDIPVDLTVAYAAAQNKVYLLATNQAESTAALQMSEAETKSNASASQDEAMAVTAALHVPQAQNKLKVVGLSDLHNVAKQAHFQPIPHGGNVKLRNALPHAEQMVAEQAVLATNDTLYTYKPFYAALDTVHKEQDKLRAEAKQKIDAVVKGLAWDAEQRAEQATRDALANMPPPYLNAGIKRLRRTLYDRITQHVPGNILAPSPAPAPAPSPLPAPTVKTSDGDADSKEIETQMKKVAKETLLQATAEISDTKRWMKIVADKYTADAAVDAVKAGYPATQAIGQQLEMQIMSGDVSTRAQSAFVEAVNTMQANAAAAAKVPADGAAFSVASEAVHIASKAATEALSAPIARQSILNAQHVLGGVASGVVVDQLDDKVQEIRADPDMAHHIDHTFNIINQNAPADFSKLATQTANTLIAQMKMVSKAALPGPSPAPAAL